MTLLVNIRYYFGMCDGYQPKLLFFVKQGIVCTVYARSYSVQGIYVIIMAGDSFSSIHTPTLINSSGFRALPYLSTNFFGSLVIHEAASMETWYIDIIP